MDVKTIIGFFKKTVVEANVYPPLTARKQQTSTENSTPTPPSTQEQTQK